MHQLKRPTIGLVVPSLEQGGGVPAVAEFIYQTIQRDGRFDTQLISLATSAFDPLSVSASRPTTWFKGVEVKSALWRGRKFTKVGALGSEFEFQRYMRRGRLSKLLEGCDIIQMVCGSPAWANSITGLNKPVSLQVATRAVVERRRRDSSASTLAGHWRRSMTYITDKLDDRALLSVNAVQLENPWMLDYVRELNRSRENVDIRYAPPGVNADLFCPVQGRLTSPNPYILCVGRLDDPRKNVGLILEAFRALPPSLENVHLITAGSGRPPQEYWKKVEALGLSAKVRHVHRPETSDLVKLYQNALAFALSSDEEGLGVVILEAMACGIPVVATRCGGPDGIIADGKDGFLVSLDDPAAMSDRLNLLCMNRNLNIEMGVAARKTILARYADEVAGKAFVEIWENLLQWKEKG
jgi:glycosyltransferase involved in cell wall biosynthesis